VPYGSSISVSGNTITINGQTITATAASSTAQYSYAFSSWSNATGTVTGARTITANFTRSTRSYTVTIARNNTGYGTVSSSSISVPYGSSISVSGNTITINGQTITATAATTTAQYSYAFSSWSNATGTVTGARTITANFTRSTRSYTVTIARNDTGYGTVSSSSLTVPYGSSISVSGNTITINGQTITATAATSTSTYNYAFSSWSKTSGTITGTTTITANFTRSYVNYRISSIPSNVKVYYVSGSSGLSTTTALTTSTNLHYNDVIKVQYTASDGYDKETFSVSGVSASTTSTSNLSSGYIQGKVTGNITISYSQVESSFFTYSSVDGGYAVTGLTTSGKKLTNIEIPSEYNGRPVVQISNKAIYNNSTITTLVIPDSIKTIEGSAIYSCSKLESVTIGKGVTTMGGSAFYSCSAIKTINYNAINCADATNSIFSSASSDGVTITIGNSVNHLPSCLFRGATNISKITIGSGLTSTGSYVFSGTIASMNYLGSFASWCSIQFGMEWSNPTYYTKALYINGSKISGAVTIPSSVTNMGDFILYNCVDITKITIEAKGTVGRWAFSHCDSLEHIIVGQNITHIQTDMVSNCANIKSVYIPSTVLTIDGDTMSGAFGYGPSNKPSPSPNLKIYCGASSKPADWASTWNKWNAMNSAVFTTYWGYTLSQYKSAVGIS